MDWLRLKIVVLFLVSYFSGAHSHELGASCSADKDCEVTNSICMSGVCTCNHYYAQFNSTECLNSKLLDHDCLVDKQCSLRVANSECRNGVCDCSEGFIRFRKHTCLKPAKPNDVCYSDEHCQMWNRHSACEFVIPNLFGKCRCKSNTNCYSTEPSKQVAANEPTEELNTIVNLTEDDDKKESELLENSWHQNNPTEGEDTQFADPFSHQKEHLQGSIPETDSEKDGAEVENLSQEIDENRSNELMTENPESEFENSVQYTKEGEEDFGADNEFKYRVETNQNDLNYQVLWNNTTPVSLGYPCYSDIQCRKRDNQSRCVNGVCDCVIKTRDANSCARQNTGCPRETFQCRSSGACISWYFVCNGKKDCDDGSDEECEGPVCPRPSFQCSSNGNCVSLAVLCDGSKNCPNGEDEQFCLPQNRNSTQGCPDNTFQCASGECLPQFEFCNAKPKCSDASDEFSHICKPKIFSNISATSAGQTFPCPFECGNGKCRSTAIVCSGRNGCGDNSDENHCSICRCGKS